MPENKFSDFIKEKGIKSLEDLVSVTLGLVKNMSNHSHTLETFEERQKYRKLKYQYIKFLYRFGFINRIEEQRTMAFDYLILFRIGNKIMHMRKNDVDFLNDKQIIISNPEIYQKFDRKEKKIDLEFLNYLDVLKSMCNEECLKAVKLI